MFNKVVLEKKRKEKKRKKKRRHTFATDLVPRESAGNGA